MRRNTAPSARAKAKSTPATKPKGWNMGGGGGGVFLCKICILYPVLLLYSVISSTLLLQLANGQFLPGMGPKDYKVKNSLRLVPAIINIKYLIKQISFCHISHGPKCKVVKKMHMHAVSRMNRYVFVVFSW